jgi:uncharacterized heparinase superfamily protein
MTAATAVAQEAADADHPSDRECARRFLELGEMRGVHVPPCTPAALENARRVLENEFELIGETYRLPSRFSWRVNPSRDKEWQIAHHKHYWAVDLLQAWRASGSERYLEKWTELTTSWLDEMGTGFIAQSDAQVEAKRVEHWVYACALLREGGAAVPPDLLRRWLTRMAEEARYIAGHLKPTRNHRTFQLFAVALASLSFPELDPGGELARFAVDQLTANLLTDVLPDGVQVELSTHYHQLVLETAVAFLEVARANGVAVARELEERIARGLAFALHVQWPDGHLPLVNDSDDGSQEDLLRRGAALFGDDEALLFGATLGAQGRPPARPGRFFEESGYFVLRDGWGRDRESHAARQHVVYDCGRLGDGAHSHYDVFSFCYFAGGAPLIVDPGRYTYDASPRDGVDWRHWFKSTAAHNTVGIDGLDQTRYVSRNKHGPDATVRGREFRLGDRSDWVRASVVSHEYAPVHQRFFLYMRREYLFIADRVDPADGREHEAVVRFHFPDRLDGALSLREGASGCEVTSPDALVSVHGGGPATSRVEPGWVSTSYGKKRAAPVLAVAQRAADPMLFCSVVAPVGGAGAPRVVSTREQGFSVTHVHGTSASGPYHDTMVTAVGDELPVCDLPGLRCRARDLAIRRDASGRITYLVAAGAEHVEVNGIWLAIEPSGVIEWNPEVSS